MPRGQSPTHDLAYWFWHEVLEREDNPWTAPGFPRYLREAKRCLKKLNLDIEILKQALVAMKQQGFDVQSLLLPTLLTVAGPNSACWYEHTEERMKTPPPVYEPHALREWAIQQDRQDIIDYLDGETQ